MVQIVPRQPSTFEKIIGPISEGMGNVATGMVQRHQQQQQAELYKKLGIDPEMAKLAQGNPAIMQALITSNIQKNDNKSLLRGIEKSRGLEEGSLDEFISNPSLGASVSKPEKPEGGINAQPVPPNVAKGIKKIVEQNPNATSDQLGIIMDEEGIPPAYSNRFLENRRQNEEQKTKSSEAKTNALRAETKDFRNELAKKAASAEQGIQNKERLLEIIDRGDINDPTFAAVASALPLDLGKRLLSNDTVEYKAGLVDEFKDLRNIFQGQTRLKEIELLEDKLADVYLTDSQKKAVLKSRMGAGKADIIYAEVAAEMEDEPLGILQFQKELQKRAKPRLEGLFNQILDEQKAIIQNAENKKKVPLDPNDPEDKKIAQAIIKEAGGNRTKAREIAKKKGYTLQ